MPLELIVLFIKTMRWFLDTLRDSMENAKIGEEKIIDKRVYHTIKEVKNGAGATPIKTKDGWLHIAHGVRNTAAGLRYVLCCFMTALDDPTRLIYTPGGYFIAPRGWERVGDVSNVVFCNGAIENDGKIYILCGIRYKTSCCDNYSG